MRWLIIALLVSLGALLLAAAGMARHILVRRAKLRSKPSTGSQAASEAGDETEVESRH